MSELIKHECGIALIRLLKEPEHYRINHGNALYGITKLHLMMQKQHNRGQDGAGIACIKLNMDPGQKYIHRHKSNSSTPLRDIFNTVYNQLNKLSSSNPDLLNDTNWLKTHSDFFGELYLGHLRYGTFGKNSIENLHPVLRENNWITRCLALAGNFNMTNVDELFEKLIDLGQYPTETSDTVTILEKIGHFLDDENERLYQEFKLKGHSKKEITNKIIQKINILQILTDASKYWDGGYAIAGILGHGDSFVMRDPNGIRPAYFYAGEDIIVAASERPVIQTAFNVNSSEIQEVPPGHALIIRKSGDFEVSRFQNSKPKKSCSFERIYFSRGTDESIYKERKNLGKLLVPAILESIDNDLENTVFSYIPNTAVVAFRGLIDELNRHCNEVKKQRIIDFKGSFSDEELSKILNFSPRVEEIAVKDAKLRTFITEDKQRDELVGHVYDITYGSIRPGIDNLVILDDSIVRGTTLKQSIIRILDRLGPKKIIIASSAPQIRYPDCYGIDMARLGDFVAFKAAIELLKETHQEHVINAVYRKAIELIKLPKEEITNCVKDIYRPFKPDEISKKIAQIVTPRQINSTVEIVYQSIENLHKAIPEHTGDWYFTGNYPTPGGNKVVVKSFINFIEGRNSRAY